MPFAAARVALVFSCMLMLAKIQWLDLSPDPCNSSEINDPRVVLVEALTLLKETKTQKYYRTSRCTGVVVGPNQVLTANHCLKNNPGIIRVWLNAIDSPVLFYTPDETGEDLALLETMDPTVVNPPPITKAATAAGLVLEGFGCRNQVGFNTLQRPAQQAWGTATKIGIFGCVCHGDSGGAVFDSAGNLFALMDTTEGDGRRGTAVKVWEFLHRQGLASEP